MKPLPKPNAETVPYWTGARAGELRYQQCRECGKIEFPPKPVCTGCWTDGLVWKTSAGQGFVYSFTIVQRAPTAEFKADAPYVIALVDIAEGFRIMVNLRGEGALDIAIGTPVEIFFEPTELEDIVLPQARCA